MATNILPCDFADENIFSIPNNTDSNIFLCDFNDENMFSIPDGTNSCIVYATRTSYEYVYLGRLTLLTKLVLLSTTHVIYENYSVHTKEKIKSVMSDLINQNSSDDRIVDSLTVAIMNTNSDPYEIDIIKILLSSNILLAKSISGHTVFDWALHNDNCNMTIMILLVDKIPIPVSRNILFVSTSEIHSDVYSTKLNMLIDVGFSFKKRREVRNSTSSLTPLGRLDDCYNYMICQYKEEIKQYKDELAQIKKEYDIVKKSVELSPDGPYMNDIAQHFMSLSKLQK